MESNGFAYQLISQRQDRLEDRVEVVEEGQEEIPVLRKEVQLLTKAVDRNTTALYSVVGSVIGGVVLLFLTQRGVF